MTTTDPSRAPALLRGLALCGGLWLAGASLAGAQPPGDGDPRYRLGELVEESLSVAEAHYRASSAALSPAMGYPASVIESGSDAGATKLVPVENWVSGFYPGVLWYLYEATADTVLRASASAWTEGLSSNRSLRNTHDLGFMMGSSYGNGYRLTGRPAYRRAVLASAASLSSRFDPDVGSTESWDWGGNRWTFPVIVDNMMNLELLTTAERLTSAEVPYREQAVSHAETTMRDHFREDYTNYHVVDYNPVTGQVIKKITFQGYADESMWARGQAWAIYGYVMMARETGDTSYRRFAERLLTPYLARLPADHVPYWDFDDPDIPDAPRDASAAAIVASALLELHVLSGETDDAYLHRAEDMLESLSSPEYRAAPGTNADFVLRHATGNKPQGREIDVPLVYADYYFVEALLRYRALAAGFRDDIATVTVPEDTTDVVVVEDLGALIGLPDGSDYEVDVRSFSDAVSVRVDGDRLLVRPGPNYFGQTRVELRVEGADSAAAFRFEVAVTPVNDAPGAFALLAPADGERLRSNNLLFRWGTAADVEDDDVTYALTLAGGGLDTVIAGIPDARLRFAGGDVLEPGTAYTWSVTASDGADETAVEEGFAFVSEGTSGVQQLAEGGWRGYYDAGADALRFALPSVSDGEATVAVYDAAGRRCRARWVAVSSGAAALDVSGLPAGTYVYSVRGLNGTRILSGTFVKPAGR